jgi:hypothetical protein
MVKITKWYRDDGGEAGIGTGTRREDYCRNWPGFSLIFRELHPFRWLNDQIF